MIQSPRFLAALATLCLLVGFAGSASAQDKLDRALREGKAAGETQRVILKTADGYGLWARQLLHSRGKRIDAEMPSVNGLALELSASELESFCSQAYSKGCSKDADVSPSGRPEKAAAKTTTTARNSTAVYSTRAVNTLVGTLGLPLSNEYGAGVTVALIDSGIYPSPAFAHRIKAFYDFTNGGVRVRVPFDDYGHGTHVAGLIGGLQYRDDAAFQGIAPSVQFVALKVLDGKGAGKTSDVIRAVEFAIANKDTFGIDIINLSLGHPIFEPAASDPLVQVVERATRAGIVVVASAGNHGVTNNGELGFAGTTYPGNAPSAITVGAADPTRR